MMTKMMTKIMKIVKTMKTARQGPLISKPVSKPAGRQK
jgi:hypothetical protein